MRSSFPAAYVRARHFIRDRLVLILILAALLGLTTTEFMAPVKAAAADARRARYQAPVLGPAVIVNAFDDLTNPYAAGHRGVDLALSTGSAVRAAGAGVVSFAGQVAGRGVLVIGHPDGVSTEYEPLTAMVKVGQPVLGGQQIGILAFSHPGCARSCLHWGARRAGRYFNPMQLLLALGIVRLLPCHARGWACW